MIIFLKINNNYENSYFNKNRQKLFDHLNDL